MTAKDFWIDQIDPPYPQIRHRTHPLFDSTFEETYTFEGARREIKEICRSHRNHWLTVRHNEIGRTLDEVIRDAIRAQGLE